MGGKYQVPTKMSYGGGWVRAIKTIVPYFHLLGTCSGLKFENKLLRGKIMELEFEKKYLRTFYTKGFLATLTLKR